MKTLGLVGGTSWHSTVEYYSHINREVHLRMGGLNSAQLLLFSINLHPFAMNNEKGDFEGSAQITLDAARRLKAGGAEALVLCANTLHLFAERVEAEIDLPVIHVATATAAAIRAQGLNKVALLGTRFTMEMPFIRDILIKEGIEILIPEHEDCEFVHDSIFHELARGIFTEAARQRYIELISSLQARGAQGAILGCTEIPMLIKADDVDIPLFDTALIHSQAAVEFALS